MITLAQRIEELRMQKGISRVALAQTLGLPKMSIEKFETGRLTPNREQQEKLARYFDVSVPYLKGEADDPGTMGSWLSGNLPPEEEVTMPQRTGVKKQAASSAPVASSGSVSGALFQSESFKQVLREAVLDVLRSPEGQKILSNAIRKEMQSGK